MGERKSDDASESRRGDDERKQPPGERYQPTVRDLEAYACLRQLMEGRASVVRTDLELKEEK
jgi:hypothetical protein